MGQGACLALFLSSHSLDQMLVSPEDIINYLLAKQCRIPVTKLPRWLQATSTSFLPATGVTQTCPPSTGTPAQGSWGCFRATSIHLLRGTHR